MVMGAASTMIMCFPDHCQCLWESLLLKQCDNNIFPLEAEGSLL